MSQIIDLFVRVNSTGRALNRQERTHAKYYQSYFLRRASRLAETLAAQFVQEQVLSKSQISRMKHVELVSELMLSFHNGDVIHKKQALDAAMSPKGLPASFLAAFGAGVDELREQQKRAEGIPGEMVCRTYLQTVLEGTDTAEHRKVREKILRGLFGSVFEKKDPWRLITPEQRRVVWQRTEKKVCVLCNRPESWDELALDHVEPHSRGGRRAVLNAGLAHKSNSSAGDKSRPRQVVRPVGTRASPR